MNRWPALILVFGLIAGVIVADRLTTSGTEAADSPLSAELTGPQSAAPGLDGSTWYCPAGFTTPDGSNDHVVIITNPTSQEARGTLTLFPALLDTQGNSVTLVRDTGAADTEPLRATQDVIVAGGSQVEVSLAPLVVAIDPRLANNTGAFVAALAEFEVSGVTVEHRIMANQGSDIGPCATSAATSWWFASGTTTADVGYQLYLLNPFPNAAVVDISFVTDDGSRSPTAFNGRLVPAKSLTVLQVAPEVAVNAQVTAEIEVLTGRVIAERIQLFNNEAGPTGLSLSLGSNRLAEQWFFPAGRSIPGAGESYVIYNPGDVEAEVEFELKPDSADRTGDIAPLPVPVGPRQRWIVTVSTHPTHPIDALASIDATNLVGPAEQYFVSVRSFNDAPIVVERVLTRPLADGGVTASLGMDVASTDQEIAMPQINMAESATLAVLNPAGNTISQVEVLAGTSTGEQTVATAELAPRRRARFDLLRLIDEDTEWIRIRSTTGTIAEMTIAVDDTVLSTTAVPVQGTTSTPELLVFE